MQVDIEVLTTTIDFLKSETVLLVSFFINFDIFTYYYYYICRALAMPLHTGYYSTLWSLHVATMARK